MVEEVVKTLVSIVHLLWFVCRFGESSVGCKSGCRYVKQCLIQKVSDDEKS